VRLYHINPKMQIDAPIW